MEKKKFRIISKNLSGVRLFLKLSPNDGRNLSFEAGQFVKIISPNKKEEPRFRFYSIASPPSVDYLEFMIKVVGNFTNHLASLEVGEILEIEGTFGEFRLPKKVRNALFIAGGVGVAPIRSILRYINDNNIKGNFVFFYSNKTRDFAFYDEFIELNKNPSIKIIFTITRECPEGWKGERGRIDKKMLAKYLPSIQKYHAFLCGPVKMSLAIKELLKELGIEEKNIILEAWG